MSGKRDGEHASTLFARRKLERRSQPDADNSSGFEASIQDTVTTWLFSRKIPLGLSDSSRCCCVQVSPEALDSFLGAIP